MEAQLNGAFCAGEPWRVSRAVGGHHAEIALRSGCCWKVKTKLHPSSILFFFFYCY
jgi:hypothetical protein